MFSTAYTKKNCSEITIRPSLWLQILSNPSQRYDSSSEILICKYCTWQNVRNLLNFLPFPPCMIPSHQDKSYDFHISFAFLKFENHSVTRLWPCFLNKMFKIPFHFTSRPLTKLTWISFFYSPYTTFGNPCLNLVQFCIYLLYLITQLYFK